MLNAPSSLLSFPLSICSPVHLSFFPSIHLPIPRFVHLIYLSIPHSICPCIDPFIHVFLNLSIHPFIRPPIHLSIHQSAHPSSHWYTHPSIHSVGISFLTIRCPRFTMHQQNRSDSQALDYVRLMTERPKAAIRSENDSTSLAMEPDACGMSQMTYNKQLVRPKSCRTQGGEGESRPITAKHKLRAKSAHPRLIPATTPVNTNASTLQLQVRMMMITMMTMTVNGRMV